MNTFTHEREKSVSVGMVDERVTQKCTRKKKQHGPR